MELLRRKEHSLCEPDLSFLTMNTPLKHVSSVQGMVKELDRLYSAATPRWSNISELALDLGWTELVAQTAAEYFDSKGVSKKFSREVVEAATRVNYGQV